MIPFASWPTYGEYALMVMAVCMIVAALRKGR